MNQLQYQTKRKKYILKGMVNVYYLTISVHLTNAETRIYEMKTSQEAIEIKTIFNQIKIRANPNKQKLYSSDTQLCHIRVVPDILCLTLIN